MKRLVLVAAVMCPVLMVLATVVGAQSLGDVARKEEQRRKDIRKPARVYTNKDLGQVEPPPAPAPAPAPPASAGEGSAEEKKADGPAEPTDEEKRAADREQWRARITQARTELDRSKMFAEALQTRANSLWADFTARDDPAQRSVIEAERKKTLAELDRVKTEIEARTKAIADLEEEARRAGIPPGWLR
jgi:hypothetical protein